MSNFQKKFGPKISPVFPKFSSAFRNNQLELFHYPSMGSQGGQKKQNPKEKAPGVTGGKGGGEDG
jgi:hypothetical protein